MRERGDMGLNYAHDPNWLETCIKRMERTLNSPPRKAKTARYVATLPKRPKVAVGVSDYDRAREAGRTVVAAMIAKTTEAINDAPTVYRDREPRKDRMRPRAGNTGMARSERTALLPVLMRAQKRRCASCAGLMFDKANECETGFHASIDHVYPRAHGGPDAIGNFVAMHYRCNQRKADRAPTGCELIWLAAVNAAIGAAILARHQPTKAA